MTPVTVEEDEFVEDAARQLDDSNTTDQSSTIVSTKLPDVGNTTQSPKEDDQQQTPIETADKTQTRENSSPTCRRSLRKSKAPDRLIESI